MKNSMNRPLTQRQALPLQVIVLTNNEWGIPVGATVEFARQGDSCMWISPDGLLEYPVPNGSVQVVKHISSLRPEAGFGGSHA
jgi:hypothetical protein